MMANLLVAVLLFPGSAHAPDMLGCDSEEQLVANLRSAREACEREREKFSDADSLMPSGITTAGCAQSVRHISESCDNLLSRSLLSESRNSTTVELVSATELPGEAGIPIDSGGGAYAPNKLQTSALESQLPHLRRQLRHLATISNRAVPELAVAAIVEEVQQGNNLPWAGQSPNKQTEQLQLNLGERGKNYRSARRATKRRSMQSDTQGEDADIVAHFNVTDISCSDHLATNDGAASGCAYECQTLQDHYFPGQQSRCFMFDAATATWPEVGGQGDELLHLRQRYNYLDSFLSSEDGTILPDDGVSFVIGDGRQCRNVTVRTTLFGMGGTADEVHTEVMCLLDGEHEFSHTAVGSHSIEVVGYAESEVHIGPGGTTPVVIGDCTPVLVRIATTVSDGPIVLLLDDDGHNGPWVFEVPGEIGVHEIESCLFDNNYTMVRQPSDTGWQGSVEVVGFVQYHDTIEIPNNENWIVQGSIDVATGLPATLDGRLQAGTPFLPSQSSIVLRDVRFTGQTAPVDQYLEWRNTNGNVQPDHSFGGAFSYTGGGEPSSNLPRLAFERVIFDHNSAVVASAVYINGRAGMPVPTDSSQTNWDSGISWTMHDCTFFRNQASWGAGAIGFIDVWPMHFLHEDVDFIQNSAPFIAAVWAELNPLLSSDRRRTGESWIHRKRCHFDGGWSEGQAHIMFSAFTKNDPVDDPDAVMNFTYDRTTYVDHGTILYSQVEQYGWWPPQSDLQTKFNVHLTGVEVAHTHAITAGDTYDSCYFMDLGINTLVERSRFHNNGPVVEGGIGMAGYAIYRGHSARPDNWPSVRFVNTEFVDNTGPNGAAVSIVDGVIDLSFDGCIIRGNVAKKTGGAIAFDAAASSKLRIERSIFDSNLVALAPGDVAEETTPAVVNANTGGLGEGSQDVYGAYHAPVWRIDNGPVYGVPWELCEAAKQYSLNAVAQGFPETWPSDLECANVTYHTGRSYSQVQYVSNGVHTLWHGVITQGAQIVTTWLKGSIQVTDSVGPIYPTFVDYRQQHQPACSHAGHCGRIVPEPPNCVLVECCCKSGVALWSSTDFFISKGFGGAVDVRGPVGVTIRDSTFQNNDAPRGASVAITSAADVTIVGTTIDETAHFFNTEILLRASAINTCAENPCGDGEGCFFRQFSTWCERCQENELGDGLKCSQCLSGTQPNANQTACEPCDPGSRSEIGLCQDCVGEGLVAPRFGQALCDQCPRLTRADATHTQCLCDSGTYNSTSALHVCFFRGFDTTHFEAEQNKHRNRETEFDCASCPIDQLGESCLTCRDGRTVIAPGFTIPRLPASAVDRDSDYVSVFRCHSDKEIAEARCPGSDGMRRSLSEGEQQELMCSAGYKGYMCGECAAGFGMNSEQVCTPCDDTGFTWATLGAVVASFAAALLVLAIIGFIWGKFPLQHVVRCAAQPLRILITYSQVTSQLGDVLDFQYPGIFGKVIETLRPIIDVWGLLFRALGPSECFGVQGFTSRWLLRVVALPTIMMFCVLMVFIAHYRTHGKAYAMSNARGNSFFVVFFCYPTICIVSFAAFICQPITESTSVLEIDDAVICEDWSHRMMQWCSGSIIVIVAIGLPLGLLRVLTTKALYYENHTRKQYSDVAKRMSVELGVELNVAEYVIRDIVVGSDFGFLMDAFQPAFLYWEALDMIRKLFLVGLVLLVGRGSIAQLTTAIALSFCFFALHMRSWPYKVQSDNMFRAATELHVFIVISTALVLKNNLSVEVVTEEIYDTFLFLSFIVLVPASFCYAVISKVRFMNKAVQNGLSLKSVEPAEMRRRSFELHMVGLGSRADKENLRRFIDGWAVTKSYAAFLSHYKAEAAAEARVMKAELVRALKVPDAKIFLDADNLTDLRDLLDCVRNSDVLVLMWTKDVLSRPWCLAEINAAAEARVPIIVVKINNSYSSPITTISTILSDLAGYLKRTNKAALGELQGEEIQLADPSALAATIKDAIDIGTKDELTFDPNQSSVMLGQQICDLAGAMVMAACPENAALLPDLAPKAAEPWIVARSIAIYIVFAEQDPGMKLLAKNVKEWLCRRTDLASDLIRLCSDTSADRSIDDASAGDCDDAASNVDTVLMLQTKQLLTEPRGLARLYVAVANRAPVVPIWVTSTKAEHQSKLWNFDTAKSTLDRLSEVLGADKAAAVAAASGAPATQVGKVLAQVIPNVISKPLEIDGVRTQFEAQMLDIELTLRREMPAASVATTTAARRSTVVNETSESVPPVARSARTKTRVAARVVARSTSRTKSPARAEVGV